MTITGQDKKFLDMTLKLAAKARGRTSPNPMVGAVIVKHGRVIAEGYHRRCGQPHAEVIALRNAGSAAAGGVLYVNLEPCAHTGRTPPCVDSIIAAGISRVVAGMRDPNPLVRGKGFARLKKAGIATALAENPQEFQRFNEIFVHYITQRRPLVIVKAGQSLDGKIATRSGHSQWITGANSRRRVHHLRSIVDAVLVGVHTVRCDNPRLSCRTAGRGAVRPLTKIILDPHAATAPSARIFSAESPGPVLLVVAKTAPPAAVRALEAVGAQIIRCPLHGRRFDLSYLLEKLAARQISSLLVEGGGTTHGAFFDARLVDRIYWFIAPLIIGGDAAVSSVAGTGCAQLGAAARVRQVTIERLGSDILVSGRVYYPKEPL